MHDCGLFGALSNTPPDLILLGSQVFEEYKGAFTEQFVLQRLKWIEETFVYYYTNDDSTLEIDFLVQYGNKVFPIEVKAEENLQSKSLKSFLSKNPALHGIRFSMSPYREQERTAFLRDIDRKAINLLIHRWDTEEKQEPSF